MIVDLMALRSKSQCFPGEFPWKAKQYFYHVLLRHEIDSSQRECAVVMHSDGF